MNQQQHESSETVTQGMSPEMLSILVDNHARFLAFLTARVGRSEIAEELLQEAFVRAIARGDSLRDGEAVTAWFYRLLRNALIDHYRHRSAERRALDSAATQPMAAVEGPDHELMQTVCACVGSLVDTLKPEYADILRSVDLDDAPVSEYAARTGITSNNAAVRLHRARKAAMSQLVQSCGTCATHGCLNCTCTPT
jgi:RNA polymerase sigma factor (sigma-70 family)